MDSLLIPTPSKQFAGMKHAENYLKYRPEWPQELVLRSVAFLMEKVKEPFKLALDVGCGSGQSSRPLAPHFKSVLGIDVSQAQIEVAQTAVNPKNVEYIVGRAENIPLPRNSVDFISSGESFHWFDKEAFFREIDRVLTPGGCVAVYLYGRIMPWVEGDDARNVKMKEVVNEFHDVTIGQYFSNKTKNLANPENLHVPYAEYKRENIVSFKESTVDLYLNYVRTLSGYQNYIEQNTNGEDILNTLSDRLLAILEAPSAAMKIYQRSPVCMLLGRKPDIGR
ncbi:putative methyltransferase DDB_G0268948 [Asterias rubens]|uniref:putative methyltransferase DDB_G0268948 n=1 Tax=Asterias rubens TaxID=7604 RepID=UPI0014559DF3|nr:putative methyltransferase DDB_G0268948 [Asterias rubens]